MNDILVMLLVSFTLVFHPSTSQSSQSQCRNNPVEFRAVPAGDCQFAQKPALEDDSRMIVSNQTDNRKQVYLPSIQVSRLLQEIDEALDIDRIIDKPVTQEKYHIVRPAETLVKIARIYNTTDELLQLANPQIVNRNLIHIGAQLRIPSPAETESLRKEAEQRRLEDQRRIMASVAHGGKRWIDVDLQTQTVRAYDGDVLLNTFIASTGTARYPTVKGQYRIWVKLKSDDMRGPGYDLKDVPYVMYFHKGYGIHGTYWHNNFGTPMSHGCVNLRVDDAAWLFNFSSIGTLVNVH